MADNVAHYRYERIILDPTTNDVQVYEDGEWKTIDRGLLIADIGRVASAKYDQVLDALKEL